MLDDARGRAEVREISIGDYVLNGGEVAALAITEAVVRLLPGFMGNAESLMEESHEDGLLEYPVYTKPAAWRGLEVPAVLLSGDHGAIRAWRHEQAVRRTAERRPDLAHPAGLLDDVEIRLVQPADAGELLMLQRACWVQEQHDNPGVRMPALHETLDDVEGVDRRRDASSSPGPRAGWSARCGRLLDGAWQVGRLMVAPDLHGRGLGRTLLDRIEQALPTARRRTRCSPAPGACATSGCTRRPVTGSPGSRSPGWYG